MIHILTSTIQLFADSPKFIMVYAHIRQAREAEARYRSKAAEASRRYRSNMTEEQRQAYNAKARERNRRYRVKLKEKSNEP